jgi:large repetitive protein
VTPNEVTTVRAKVSAPVPKVKGANVYAEYENDVVEPDKRLAAIGGEYQVRPKTRLYARHEFMNALGSPFELNTVQQQHTTLIGLDTTYMQDGTLFNEYRMRDAISGRESEAATGLRNLWTLSKGLRLHTTFERVSPLSGNLRSEATAGTAALEYTRNPDWKATARLELRASDPNNSLLNTVGYAHKLNQDWTFLGRSIVYLVDNKGPGIGNKTQARFQAGLAWRQTLTNAWNGLWKYECKIEEDASVSTTDLNRQVHMLLFDLNFQPHPDWQLSVHYGAKLAFEELNGIDEASDGHLIALRGSYDINPKWDVGLVGSVLFSGKESSVHFGFGPEVGYRLRDSVRLALGYNLFGFHDRDLSSEEYTDHGVYVTFRLKFDETLMGLRKEGKP